MEIEWTKEMATNVSLIDIQHKNIIAKINNFILAVNQGRGKKEIDSAMSILEEHADAHFETEEKYMIKYKYPHYKSHLAEHQKFDSVIEYLKLESELQSEPLDLVKKIKTVFERYWSDHIPKCDKPLAAFLQKHFKR